jgi:hypothetical protein
VVFLPRGTQYHKYFEVLCCSFSNAQVHSRSYYSPPLTLPSALNVSYMNIHAETNTLSAFFPDFENYVEIWFFFTYLLVQVTSFYKFSTNRGASLENLRYTKWWGVSTSLVLSPFRNDHSGNLTLLSRHSVDNII